MKIFISYGHNDHTALVDRLFDALLQAGHAPWKDDRYEGTSGIYAGEDFTQVIYDAIDDSDFVIAIVSEVTQAKPYCRDERQYAYNTKGSHFIQIRLDHAQLRLGNSNSYIDMSDVESDTGTIDEALFQKQLQALFSAFRDPSAFCGNGLNYWAKFEAHLKIPGVLKFHEFVGVLDTTPFVGRQWLREQCIKWVTDDTIDCRLFAILGEAGTGKTAFIRHLAADHELVKSVHVCIYDRPSTRSAKDTLKDLAYILAQNNDAYFNFLKGKNLEPISEMGVDGLFEFLFIEPLKNEQNKYLLIIDGLDELEELTGLNPLMKLFRQYATRINPNISFLVTGRPDENILNKLRTIGGGTPPEQVLLDQTVSREDLALYITQQLRDLGQYSPALTQKLLDACDGNFEYLTLLFREASREGLALTEDMKMPKGLNERYTQYLDRRMEAAGQRPRFTREQRQLLSVLCAAEEPLPLSLLADIIGMDSYDIQDEISILGSLIRQAGEDDDPLICLFTKGFRDYLLDRSCSAYCANRDQGTEQIARYIMDNCQDEKALEKHPYLDRNAYTHLLVYGSREEDEVCDFVREQATQLDTSRRIANALCKGNADAINTYCRLQAQLDPLEKVIRYLRGLREKISLTQICAYWDAHGERARSCILRGDLERMDPSPQAFLQARVWYEEALALAQAAYETTANYDCRRILAMCYERLGILAKRQQTAQGLADAAAYYQKVLELDEENYAENPCYQSRRDMSVTYEHLGLLCKQNGDTAQAEKYFLQCLTLTTKNYAQTPDYHSRRDLMFNYRRLAQLTQGARKAEARQWFLKSMEMSVQNYGETPGYESRRDLSLCYDHLGLLEKSCNNLEEASQWFRKASELDKQNCEENPCFQTRNDLAISYIRAANLAQRENTPQAREEAEKWQRMVTPLYERNYSENPCFQTRNDLAGNYWDIAMLNIRQGTTAAYPEAIALLYKSLPLYEENHAQEPSAQTRSRLISLYHQLSLLLQWKNTPEDVNRAIGLLKQRLPLLQEQYNNDTTNQHTVYALVGGYISLADAYQRMGSIHQAQEVCRMLLDWAQRQLAGSPHRVYSLTRCYEQLRTLACMEHTPQGLQEAEAWTQKLNALKNESAGAASQENANLFEMPSPTDHQTQLQQLLAQYAKAPTPQVRTALIRCYITLITAKSQEQYLEDALRLAQEAHSESPNATTRQHLALLYNCMGENAAGRHTPQGDAQALQWYEKQLALTMQAHREAPDTNTYRQINLIYKSMTEVASRNGEADQYAQADRIVQAYLSLYKQTYEEDPCYANWQRLTDVYRELVQYAKEKATPLGREEAQKWQAIYDELWEKCPTKV